MATYIIVSIIAYLLGSISFSVIFSKKLAGFDVREKGSGNAGTTNVLRTVGKKAAALTLLCDCLKGVFAVLVAFIAGKIVKEQMEEFFQWLDGRDIIPRIQEIKADAVEDLNLRIEKIFRKTPMEDSDRENLKKAVDTAAGKVVNKLIFGLRDSLNQDAFLECVEGLEKLYEE